MLPAREGAPKIMQMNTCVCPSLSLCAAGKGRTIAISTLHSFVERGDAIRRKELEPRVRPTEFSYFLKC